MTDLNNVILMGNLTRDVDFSYVGSGMAKAALSVAVNRSRKVNNEWVNEVSYFDVTYLGKGAEAVKNYLVKGTRVTVCGALVQDRWEKDGQKKSKVYVLADSVYLCGSKNGVSAPAPVEAAADDNEVLEDIPF